MNKNLPSVLIKSFVVKNGSSRGIKRYFCKVCHKTFQKQKKKTK